jgi:hypothetical protein
MLSTEVPPKKVLSPLLRHQELELNSAQGQHQVVAEGLLQLEEVAVRSIPLLNTSMQARIKD